MIKNSDNRLACKVPCAERWCSCNAFGYCLDIDPCERRRTSEEEQDYRDSITEEV